MGHHGTIARTAVSVLGRAPLRRLVHYSFPRAFFTLFHQLKASELALDASTYVLSFDLDHRVDLEAVPRVLTALRRHAILSSFACIGRWIEEYPDIHRAIVADGHEIVNHSYSHPDHSELHPGRSFLALTESEQREEISRCHAACVRVLGVVPIGFRTPHFGRAFTRSTYAVLRSLGYQYSSSTVDVHEEALGAPTDRGGIVEIPLGTSARFPFHCFDSWSAFRAPRPVFQTSAEFLDAFRASLAIVARTRSFCSHYVDPADVVGEMLEGMCAAMRCSGVTAMTYRAFLERYHDRVWTTSP